MTTLQEMKHTIKKAKELHEEQTSEALEKTEFTSTQFEMIKDLVDNEPDYLSDEDIRMLNIFERYGYYTQKHKEFLNRIRKEYIENQ